MSFTSYFKTYFAHNSTSQVRELYTSATILNFAISAVGLFEPLYLYQQGFTLVHIILFYLTIYSGYFLGMPFGAKFARKKGYEHSILVSTPFLVLYYLSLFAIAIHPVFIGSAVVMLITTKTFYWQGYNADFAKFSVDGERGREISNLIALNNITSILGPIVGGLILEFFNFRILFAVASLCILASNIPLLKTPEQFTPTTFSYKDAYKRLVRRDNRRAMVSYMGYGEELVYMYLWPIFIFFAVKNDYLSVGSLVALATLLSTLVVLYVGKISDRYNQRSVLRFGAIIKSLSWFIRVFTRGVGGIFFIQILYQVSDHLVRVPQMSMTYGSANHGSTMKRMVFFEMALVVGKITVMAVILLTLLVAGQQHFWTVAFVTSGIMTLLYMLL